MTLRWIPKPREPRFWREFREQPGARYDGPGMPKQQLRAQLAKEQGYLCCYCTGRIEPSQEGMKIEHWGSQSEHGDAQIEHRNLLGACQGNQGRPFAEQHCDTHKGNTPLTVNPADPVRDCERLFRYLADGTMAPALGAAEAPALEGDLATLNLNVEKLKRSRKAVLDSLISWLEREHGGRTASAEVLLQKAQEWASADAEGRRRPFCQVAISWLNKRARQR